MLAPRDPVTLWNYVGKGALGTLLQSAGYSTFQDLIDADVDDYTENGPVRRLHDAVQQAKERHPRILATTWDKFIVQGYNAIVIAKSAELQEVPKCFECPLSHDWFSDPVIAPSGITYERTWIERWLHSTETEPITKQPLKPSELISNRALKDAVSKYKAHQDFMILSW